MGAFWLPTHSTAMSEAITSLPPSYAIPKPQATFLFLWHRNLCQHSLTTADGGHWQSQELQGKDKKLSYLHGTTEWEQSKAQPDCFSHPGEASNLSAVVTASAFLTGISHIRADTLPSTRRDPGADCVSDNFPHVPLLFLCCSSSPAWLSPASAINFIPTIVLLLSRRTRGAHGAGNEACCPHPRPAEGGSAFGNVPTGSGVGEDTQICERPAEAVPASRSVGCLNFYVPLLRC